MEYLNLVSIGLLVIVLFAIERMRKNNSSEAFKESSDEINRNIEDSLKRIKEEFSSVRDEFGRSREEFSKEQRSNREELAKSFVDLRREVLDVVSEFGNQQSKQMKDLSEKLENLTQKNEERIVKLQEAIQQNLKEIREDNTTQLEKMRETVDEKLQKTLEQRLGESFKLVSERLEAVSKGLGEMQQLATGVGDLKKVLTNVKTKGILGEYQLGNIIEQLLPSGQYEKEKPTKKGSNDRVEYAIKMPGKGSESEVLLPIDSKFPLETYNKLVDAYDNGEVDDINTKRKELAQQIKRYAKDIHDKYISPPETTDFGILFLPVEGLYAEALRDNDLYETLQRDLKITITGPTTLAAFLNSLQMGFHTLAIEKRSSEVWDILKGIKMEFGKFGDVLEKVKKNIQTADKHVDDLLGTRTRQIERKLRDVEDDIDAGEDLKLIE